MWLSDLVSVLTVKVPSYMRLGYRTGQKSYVHMVGIAFFPYCTSFVFTPIFFEDSYWVIPEYSHREMIKLQNFVKSMKTPFKNDVQRCRHRIHERTEDFIYVRSHL